jgi:quercetin dioxygenase-like cupin family protein
MDTKTFETTLTEEGYGQIATRELEPSKEVPEHTHPFDVHAMILDGEFTLGTADGEKTYRPGDTFKLSAGIRHTEKHGPDGARLLVGRRKAA